MQKFTSHSGLVAVIHRDNIDTDAIIPKQFLKSIKKTGFGDYLFDAWRYLDVGYPGQDCKTRPINPDFVLNLPEYKEASILVVGSNFGCGSSREHAPWAILQYGIRVVISSSFADIFYNNSLKNGLLPITLPDSTLQELRSWVASTPGFRITIDLENNSILLPSGKQFAFQLPAFQRECILNGWDDIGLTLAHQDKIKAFEKQYFQKFPWLAETPSSV
ncbi:MAG: 3-isopropylmalate dehydratase small subunit [Gammaproteobacteria bacterium]|nr:3-isopropylmalate dehydratase small subunit [Gammaproteobacteria bacterium]